MTPSEQAAKHALQLQIQLQSEAARRELDRLQMEAGLRHEPGLPCPLCNPSKYPQPAGLHGG